MKSAVQSPFSFIAMIAVAVAPLVSSLSGSAQTASPQIRQAQANYGKLPMTFEANQGQTDARVKFLAHGSGYSVFLTSGQMVLALRSSSARGAVPASALSPANPAAISSIPAADSPAADAVIQINLVGSNPHPKLAGEDAQPGKVNYFFGKDPKKWQTNIPTFKQVRYRDVYPGIDLVYYGNQSRVEHDFVIAPGGDPNQVQLEVLGADQLSIDPNGDLILLKGGDRIRLQAPVLYQEFHGMRVPVAGRYAVKESNRVSFTVQAYDKTKPLVIDPVLVYGTFLGGLADDRAAGIQVDSNGSAYVAGSTQSNNFPLAQNSVVPSGLNVFLAKLDVSGSSLVYADYLGGSSDDSATAIAIDPSNHIFVTGYTFSADFPTVNPYQATSTGGPDAFVSEISPDGASLLYSTYLGGNSYEIASSIALDSAGDIYVAGFSYSLDFPTANAYQSTVSANQNGYYGQYGFLTKFAPDGASLVFSTYFAGSTNVVQTCFCQPCWPSPYSSIAAVAVDASGNAYVAGQTNTYDFPTTVNAYQTSNMTNYDQTVGFIGKFNTDGTLAYSTYFGAGLPSSYYLNLSGIAVDASGSAYVAGTTYAPSGVVPVTTPNLCDPNSAGCSSGFLTKLDPTGSTLAYSTFLASNADVNPQALLLDANNNAFVLSQSGGGNPSFLLNPIEAFTNQSDLVIQEIDPTGGTQLFSTFLGGNGQEIPAGIALDSSGAIYVAGFTNSTDYPVTAAALESTIGGNFDAFVTKIGTAAAPAVSISPSLIQFSIRSVGSVSQPNTSLLRNMGSAALTISKITTTGDFSVDNTCGSSVAASSTCNFTVTFTPTQPGPRFGSILIQDDGAGSPHFINLVGSGATAVADLAPASLTFPSLQINQTSSSQSSTLTNNGNATLVISNIQLTGDYAQTNNCPGSLGIGSSCQFQTTFTPTAGGARNGTLSITDNAPGSPHTVALSGSGYVTTATVAPSSLTFAAQNVGATSAAQSVVITNTGSNPIDVSALTPTGDFAQTNNCTAAPIAVSASCTIHLTFSPTAGGTRDSTLTISDNAQGNPHIVTLIATGLAPVARLTPSSLTFTEQTVGATSTAQTITLTNPGNGVLTVGGVQATGDFAQTNNCTSVAASGGTCTLQVTFTPTSSGTRTGAVTLTDSAGDSPQTIALTGSGIDFALPPSGGSATIKAGATATYTLPISPIGGTFSTAVTLVCAGVPAYSTCTVNPASVTPGAAPVMVTVSIKTTAASSARLSAPGTSPPAAIAAWSAAAGFGLFGMFLLGPRRRRASLLLGGFLMAGMLFWPGCGSSSTRTPVQTGNFTPPGTYTVLVIGTSGSGQHFSSITLVVQ